MIHSMSKGYFYVHVFNKGDFRLRYGVISSKHKFHLFYMQNFLIWEDDKMYHRIQPYVIEKALDALKSYEEKKQLIKVVGQSLKNKETVKRKI